MIPTLKFTGGGIIGTGGENFYVPKSQEVPVEGRLKNLLPQFYDKRVCIDTSFANPIDSLSQVHFLIELFSRGEQPLAEIFHVLRIAHGQTKALARAADRGRLIAHPFVLEEMLINSKNVKGMANLVSDQIELRLPLSSQILYQNVVQGVANNYALFVDRVDERSQKHLSLSQEIGDRVRNHASQIAYRDWRTGKLLTLSNADLALFRLAQKLSGCDRIAMNDQGIFIAGIGIEGRNNKPPKILAGTENYVPGFPQDNIVVRYGDYHRVPN